MKTEIPQQETTQVDWSKKPQLVVSNEISEMIVLVHEDQSKALNENEFVGTCLKYAFYYERFNKLLFKTFIGTITLSND